MHALPIHNLDPSLSLPFIRRSYTESKGQVGLAAVGFIMIIQFNASQSPRWAMLRSHGFQTPWKP